jgi:hypothetical protein
MDQQDHSDHTKDGGNVGEGKDGKLHLITRAKEIHEKIFHVGLLLSTFFRFIFCFLPL